MADTPIMHQGLIVTCTAWKTIKCAPQYEISEFGVVRRAIAGKGSPVGKVLSQTRHRYGYPRVKLTINGKHKNFEVHFLVAEAFIGPRPFPKAEVCHRDGNSANVHYQNLLWGTHQENESHKVAHGTSPHGERNGAAKLTEKEVRQIRSLWPGLSLRRIAGMFGIKHQAVSKIVNGHRWRECREPV